MGPSMALVDDDSTDVPEPDDEITNLLLRHERSQKVTVCCSPGLQALPS
jgi:hypothetical protein